MLVPVFVFREVLLLLDAQLLHVCAHLQLLSESEELLRVELLILIPPRHGLLLAEEHSVHRHQRHRRGHHHSGHPRVEHQRHQAQGRHFLGADAERRREERRREER